MCYLAFIFGTKESMYPIIDRVYMKDKTYYYELTKKSDLAKWSCFQSLSVKQEEYSRKCIGILEHYNQSEQEEHKFIIDWIKKGYRNVWNYANTNKVISITGLFEKYLGKRKVFTLLEIQQITFALVYLQDEGNLGTEWDSSDPQNIYMREAFESFRLTATRELSVKFYKEKGNPAQLKDLKERFYIDKHYPLVFNYLDNIVRKESDELNMREIIDDVTASKIRKRKLFSRGISQYKVLYEEFFMANGIHKFLAETITINEHELNFVLSFCQEKIKQLKMSEDVQNIFVISCLYFTILIKEYGDTKELYLDKSQVELHLTLKKQKEELQKREKQLERKEQNFTQNYQKLKDENAELCLKMKEMEQEIKRLHQIIDKSEDQSKELVGLREMLFKLDKVEEPIQEVSLKEMAEKLLTYNLVFFGGHVNLHQKLKELLPNIRFLEVEKVGIDLSFVDRVDAVIIDVNYLSHSFYYKLMSQMKKNKTKLCYLTRKQNISFIIEEIYEFMVK